VPQKPVGAVVDRWLVVGAAIASVGHAVLRFAQPSVASRLGFGVPLASLFVLWAIAIAVQAGCWWVWTAIRR
jgi:hypothetical protein